VLTLHVLFVRHLPRQVHTAACGRARSVDSEGHGLGDPDPT
jgi:hypothetical protein